MKRQEAAALTMCALAALLDKGEASSAEITGMMLERIQASGNKAYIALSDHAMEAAHAADSRRRAGKAAGVADGVPVALKDNICVKGMKMTCASRMLESFVPPYSATVVEKLEQAGTVLLGKLNMDEFGAGNTTCSSLFGPTKNPNHPALVPGGSSGGPAAAVAEDTAYAAIGSDTGGSVRQPAAFCGVVGLKPTYGRISRFGIAPLASSLDQAGLLNKSVEDCALFLGLVAGQDHQDLCSLPDPVPDYRAALAGAEGLRGLRIGVPNEYMGSEVSEEVRQSILGLMADLEGAGALVEFCAMPHLAYGPQAYCVIASAEFSSNMGRYDGIKFGYRAKHYDGYEDMLRLTRREAFGDEVKRRILAGAYFLCAENIDAYFYRAQKARALIIGDFVGAFGQYDLLLSPATPTPPWPVGEEFASPTEAYGMELCTVSANLAGLPAISVPCGRDGQGAPIGAQLIGPTLSESLVLCAAHGVEELCKPKWVGRPQAAPQGEAQGSAKTPGRGQS